MGEGDRRTVAVVGASSMLGGTLLTRLDDDPTIGRVVGLDTTEPQMPAAKLDLRLVDVGDPALAHHLEGVDVVVALTGRLATDPGLVRDEDRSFDEIVEGTRRLLDALVAAGVRRLVHLSTAIVYGAHSDNPVPIDEAAPLRANADFAPGYHQLLAEELVAAWAGRHPDAGVAILRPAILLGPGIDDVAARHLEAPRLPLVAGHEPVLQFVHVEDVAAALHVAATGSATGAFNVAAEGWLSTAEVRALLGRRPLVLPEAVAFWLVDALWRRGLSAVPCGALHYAMHPWVTAADRLHAQGWAPTRSNREILREHAAGHRAYVSLGTVRLRRRAVTLGTAAATAAAGLVLLTARRAVSSGVHGASTEGQRR